MREISGAARTTAIAIGAQQVPNKKAALKAPLSKSKFRNEA
jgi:hypothetical protein